MKRILLYFLFLFFSSRCYPQQSIEGTVADQENNDPIAGATIQVKGTPIKTKSDQKGWFTLPVAGRTATLVVSCVGYLPRETGFVEGNGKLTLLLKRAVQHLEDVVVYNGYQNIPKERATGSFFNAGNELVNRRVSTDVLSRLEDVTPGLIFNRGQSGGDNSISIRGRNTIYGNASPLIVIDNFPYEGDMNNINPNDVETITVLKDAAAASIWGSRAGNGVIVITTKKGRYNQSQRISLNANVTVGEKPDQFYHQRMSSSDFVEIEKLLFSRGYYTTIESSLNNAPITPGAEILIAARDGKISNVQAQQQLELLKTYDVRADLDKYFYQRSVNQQYAFNLAGGVNQQRYQLSAGVDRNRPSLVGNTFQRVTLSGSNSYLFLKNKLEVSAGVYFTQSRAEQRNSGASEIGMSSGSPGSVYPYARLADENGLPLAITRDYRAGFVQRTAGQGFLDWAYRPLEEIGLPGELRKSLDYRLNGNIGYKIFAGLKAELLYQYNVTRNDGRYLQGIESYFTRNLINRFTQGSSPSSLTFPVPRGGILDQSFGKTTAQSFRGQLNFDKIFNDRHEVHLIGGYELRDYLTTTASNRLYGYDDEHAVGSPVNYQVLYPQSYQAGNAVVVPFRDATTELTDRYISYYANGAYTFNRWYTFSASVRLDRSNLFGVNTNQQGVPLYSTGVSWDIGRAGFYKFSGLPELKLRLTYGYNGNVNKSLSAYTTAQFLSGNLINQPYARIVNPPNPELRWERVEIINAGLDFSVKGNRLSGSVDLFFKKGKDLIGDQVLAPSTGILTFRGNTANTLGRGVDVAIKSLNLVKQFKWQTDYLFSFASDKVINYDRKQSALYYTQYADGSPTPLSDRPYYGLYSFRFAGLDPTNGDPQGYVAGNVSKDYASILNNTSTDDLIFHGSARPTVYGAVRNTFSYAQISLSFNVSYRFNYYFRKPGISYGSVLSGSGFLQGNYSNRWQKPGDELTTSIPSMPVAINNNRDIFYNSSAVTVDKGDHIRLQDINVSYNFTQKPGKWLGKGGQLYLYANNLGILWKASHSGYDPDYSGNSIFPPVTTLALGCKFNL